MATTTKKKNEEKDILDAAKETGFASDSEGWTEASPDFAKVHSFDREGDVLIGIYLSKKVVPVEKDDGTTQDTNLYLFATAEPRTDVDNQVGVWGSYAVDKKMEEIPVGSQVRIEYRGKEEIEGGKSVNRFRIQYR